MRRRRKIYSKRKGTSKTAWIAILGLIVGGGAYIFTSPDFEREKPVIDAPKNMYWNRRDPLSIKISDNLGIKSYEVTVSDGESSIVVVNSLASEPNLKEKIIEVQYPKKPINGIKLNPKSSKFTVTVKVTDISKWNFLQGNTSIKNIDVEIDYKRPDVNILANSYSITQGGSALVVFQVSDKSLKSFVVKSGNKEFKAVPYRKEGYYASLVAWPFNHDTFSVKIIAEDMAKNKRIVNVPFYFVSKRYKVSWIEAKDKFIDGKISDLADNDPQYSMTKDKITKLKFVNEEMRANNEKLIHELSSKVSDNIVDEWKIRPFYPLKNAAKVASYGDHRHYYYKNKSNEVSESYHVGLDLASTKMAPIIASNAGKVVFTGSNGIYGNMPMISHGMGLYTLYGHCSTILVQEGDEVNSGDVIAKTGTSGLALGDHLHFGVLVQGIEVRPEEWMDKKWIHNNIDKVFEDANKIIND